MLQIEKRKLSFQDVVYDFKKCFTVHVPSSSLIRNFEAGPRITLFINIWLYTRRNYTENSVRSTRMYILYNVLHILYEERPTVKPYWQACMLLNLNHVKLKWTIYLTITVDSVRKLHKFDSRLRTDTIL